MDPVGFTESNLQSFNRYAYANNNPYRYVDPDGRYVEAAFEAASIAVGFDSLRGNIQAGNWGAATVDGLGLVADGIMSALPVAPGVVGLGIKAVRETGEVAAKEAGELASAANYRSLFKQARPDLPSGWQVHHSMPQRYEELMRASGVNVHDVQFLRGVSPQVHSKITTEWARFYKAAGGNPSAAQIADFAKHLDKRYDGSFMWPGF